MGKSVARSGLKNSSGASIDCYRLGLWLGGEGHKKGGRKSGRPLARGLFALLRFQFREPFEDEPVRLVSHLPRQRAHEGAFTAFDRA
jgi:hypothetical protein